MQFIVCFKGFCCEPVEISKITGLDHVDQVRKEIGLSNYPIEKIFPFDEYKTDVKIVLEESIARETGLFKDTEVVKVETSRGFLNKYVTQSPEWTTSDTGEIILKTGLEKRQFNAKPILRSIKNIDDEQILKDWKAAGFPVEWNTTTE